MTPVLEILTIITSIEQMKAGKIEPGGAMSLEIYNRMDARNKPYFTEAIQTLIEQQKIRKSETLNSIMYYINVE
jgi:hypothetical protein